MSSSRSSTRPRRRADGTSGAARLAASLALASAVTGCGFVASHEEIAPGRYRLEAPYGGSTDYREAVAGLESKSGQLCNGDYDKVHDYDRTAGGPRRLVWEIVCRNVPEALKRVPRPSRSDGI